MKKRIILTIILSMLFAVPTFAAGEQTGYQRLKSLMDQKTGVNNEITFSEDYKHAYVNSTAWTSGTWDITLLDSKPNTEGLKNFYDFVLYDDKYNKLGYVLAVKEGSKGTLTNTFIQQEAISTASIISSRIGKPLESLTAQELEKLVFDIQKQEKDEKERQEKEKTAKIAELAKRPIESLTDQEKEMLILAMEEEARLASASNATVATTSDANVATESNATTTTE